MYNPLMQFWINREMLAPLPPAYDTPEQVDQALAAAKARFDHADAPYDPDVLELIRAAETMREQLYGPAEH